MSINSFTISGHIGKNATSRTTPSGKSIISFSVPCVQGYGEHKKTSWITCKMFGKFGETYLDSLVKGADVTVSGEFVLEEWSNDSGNHSMPCLIVSQIKVSKTTNSYQQAQQQPQQAKPPQNDFGDFDDDIPFSNYELKIIV